MAHGVYSLNIVSNFLRSRRASDELMPPIRAASSTNIALVNIFSLLRHLSKMRSTRCTCLVESAD